jgi:hypothetical protein
MPFGPAIFVLDTFPTLLEDGSQFFPPESEESDRVSVKKDVAQNLPRDALVLLNVSIKAEAATID